MGWFFAICAVWVCIHVTVWYLNEINQKRRLLEESEKFVNELVALISNKVQTNKRLFGLFKPSDIQTISKQIVLDGMERTEAALNINFRDLPSETAVALAMAAYLNPIRVRSISEEGNGVMTAFVMTVADELAQWISGTKGRILSEVDIRIASISEDAVLMAYKALNHNYQSE